MNQDENIEQFFADAAERGPDLRQIDEIIRTTVPELAADRHVMPGMTKGGLAYGMYHYKYASGREGDWPAVSLVNQKHYISLYISAIKHDEYLAEQYGKRLGEVDTGKSCIRFGHIGDLNLVELKNILRDTEAWWRRQPKPNV